jgi:hypothetical protein
MFWRYHQQRKIKNAEHQREKREAFMNLISTLQRSEPKEDSDKEFDENNKKN